MKKIVFYFFIAISFPSYSQNTVQNTEIQTFMSKQSSDGVVQESMNIEFLNALEEHTKKRVKFHAEAYLKSIGSKNTNVDIQASSVYVYAGSYKLAVTRLYTPSASQVHILGIRGNQAIRVACVNENPNPIPLSYGKCADKIYEAYGIRIGPQ